MLATGRVRFRFQCARGRIFETRARVYPCVCQFAGAREGVCLEGWDTCLRFINRKLNKSVGQPSRVIKANSLTRELKLDTRND